MNGNEQAPYLSVDVAMVEEVDVRYLYLRYAVLVGGNVNYLVQGQEGVAFYLGIPGRGTVSVSVRLDI